MALFFDFIRVLLLLLLCFISRLISRWTFNCYSAVVLDFNSRAYSIRVVRPLLLAIVCIGMHHAYGVLSNTCIFLPSSICFVLFILLSHFIFVFDQRFAHWRDIHRVGFWFQSISVMEFVAKTDIVSEKERERKSKFPQNIIDCSIDRYRKCLINSHVKHKNWFKNKYFRFKNILNSSILPQYKLMNNHLLMCRW